MSMKDTKSISPSGSSTSTNSLDLVLEIDSVHQWLEDMRQVTEMECMCILQGKSLKAAEKSEGLSVHRIKETIDFITNKSKEISDLFTYIFDKISHEKMCPSLKQRCMDITRHIRALIQLSNHHVANKSPLILNLEELVMAECAKLIQTVENLINSKPRESQEVVFINQLSYLGQSFGSTVDGILSCLLQRVVAYLDHAETINTLLSAINAVISLGLEGEHMCYMLTREGCVRALFDIIRTPSLQSLHARTIRAVSTISCIAESISQLEQCRGIECLAEILADSTITEDIHSEAAGVIAQITSPCMEHFKTIAGFSENMESLVKSILGLIQECTRHEVFLLSTAAVANITFMDCDACTILLQNGAAKILVDSSHALKAQSVFAKDQVATVLANMAAQDVCRESIVDAEGIEALLQFLSTEHSALKSPAQHVSCERVHQKVAIALTRLSRDPESAALINRLRGVPRLVELCRLSEKRNDSDAVLVACLAALRKISSVCSLSDALSTDDIQQLIAPSLMDSFLLCTQKDENFV